MARSDWRGPFGVGLDSWWERKDGLAEIWAMGVFRRALRINGKKVSEFPFTQRAMEYADTHYPLTERQK